MVPLTPCTSSAVAAHGYDPAQRVLAIKLTSGRVYHYADVDADTAAAFAGAESIGKAYGSLIRGKFEHTAVTEEDAS